MSVHLSEEEQLEVLKRWWKDYGKMVVTVIVLCLVGYFAVTEWQKRQLAKAESNSLVYEQLLSAVNTQEGQSITEENRAKALDLANQLKASDTSSQYSHNAALFLAKLAVESGDLASAVKELQWVLAHKPNLATTQIATLRLARVQLALGYLDQAEALLAKPADAFKSEYTETRGDILVARGDIDGARAAYEQALAENDLQQQERSMLLQLKLDDLKVAPLVGNNP